jgi:hypothetical protein
MSARLEKRRPNRLEYANLFSATCQRLELQRSQQPRPDSGTYISIVFNTICHLCPCGAETRTLFLLRQKETYVLLHPSMQVQLSSNLGCLLMVTCHPIRPSGVCRLGLRSGVLLSWDTPTADNALLALLASCSVCTTAPALQSVGSYKSAAATAPAAAKNAAPPTSRNPVTRSGITTPPTPSRRQHGAQL